MSRYLRFKQIRSERESVRTPISYPIVGTARNARISRLAVRSGMSSIGAEEHEGNRRDENNEPLASESELPIPFADKLRNSRIRLVQGLLIRKEHNAEVLRAGFLSEA